jgi:hypothetical protein
MFKFSSRSSDALLPRTTTKQKHLAQNHPEEELTMQSLVDIVKDAVGVGIDGTFEGGETLGTPVDEPEF